MDKSYRKKELFFNNLLLLGFEKSAVEKEYRVTCDKNMFCLPNQKMFEIVTYFLFSKLNSVSGKQYVVQWPLLDRDQHQEFKKSTYAHLSSIAQESNIRFPRMVPSLLSTFCGDRFYDLYLAFSSHVVERTIKKNGNVELLFRPKGSPLNYQDSSKILKFATRSSCKKFEDIHHLTNEYFKMLMNYANDFIKLIQKIKSDMMTSENELEKRLATLASLCSENPEEKLTLESSVKKTMEYEKKVKRHWVQLEKFLEKEKRLWDSLFLAVEDNEIPVLDGATINPVIPDILVEEYSEQLNLIGSVKSDEDNQLYLLRFMKLFILYLESLSKSYRKGDWFGPEKFCTFEEPEILKIENCLNELKCLNERLTKDVLLTIKESSEILQKTLFVKDSSDDLEFYSRENIPWNFHSKFFQEKMKSSRSSAFLPVSNEVSKSSLLLDQVSASNLKVNLQESSGNDLSISNHTSEFSIVHSSPASVEALPIELRDQTTAQTCSDGTASSSLSSHCISEHISLCDRLSHNGPETDIHLHGNKIFDPESEDVCGPKTTCSLPILLNIDIDYSKPFKMRESWGLEDSLNEMTLPDDSLLD